MQLTRTDVLRHRMHRQGLYRRTDTADVLELGIQHTGASLGQALAARVDAIPYDTTGLALAWTYRGAPHLHRDADLAPLATALVAASDADAQAKLSWSTPHVRRTGVAAAEAIRMTSAAARKLITEPMSKGAVSAALTRALPDGLAYACRGCRTTHVYEQLMRLAMLPAGIELDPDTTKLVLRPRSGWRVPKKSDPDTAIRRYLKFLGPATIGEVAGFLGTTEKELRPVWPGDLIECTVDGQPRYWDTEPEPVPDQQVVRLLPPMDPYLQARDRTLIVPDPVARKQLWKILGNPGALLADGEVLGTWRPKASGKKLTITVETFAPLPKPVRTAVDAEAARIAELRGATTLDLTVA